MSDSHKPIPKSKLVEEIEKVKSTELSIDQQEELGEPLHDSSAVSGDQKEYFEMIIGMIEKKEIDVFRPESLLNKAHYDSLDEMARGKIDLTTPNLCNYLQQIQHLLEKEGAESFQMANLVETVWQIKERIENEYGDVYVI